MPLDQTETPDSEVEAGVRRLAMRRFLGLATRYWREEKKQAWGLTGALLVIVLLTLAAQLGVNRWNRFFFDALDAKNGHSILLGVGIIAVLAFATALLAVLMVHVRMRLQVRWRQWLTR